ncbi:MAG: CBS domain-containing protein [Bdellovibrionales bacterium]|nr:CBS domain-containing protein [Bdellovibrionales bacterium]
MKAIHFTYEDTDILPYVSVGEPVWRVWRKMKRLGVQYLAVVNGRALMGIVRERDIRLISQIHGGESADVAEIMQVEPLMFKENDEVSQLFTAICQEKADVFVLVNDKNQALKVITVFDVLKYVSLFSSKNDWGSLKKMLNFTREA